MNKLFTKIIRNQFRYVRKSISIGRSSHSATARCAPIVEVEGNRPPVLKGQPYLKTTFSKKGFSKTLYTPSTMRIEVGRHWNPFDRYNNDDH